MAEDVTTTTTKYICNVCGKTNEVYAIVEAQWNGTHWVGIDCYDPASLRCENHGTEPHEGCVVELKEVVTRRNMG